MPIMSKTMCYKKKTMCYKRKIMCYKRKTMCYKRKTLLFKFANNSNYMTFGSELQSFLLYTYIYRIKKTLLHITKQYTFLCLQPIFGSNLHYFFTLHILILHFYLFYIAFAIFITQTFAFITQTFPFITQTFAFITQTFYFITQTFALITHSFTQFSQYLYNR